MRIVDPSVEFLGQVPTDYRGNLKLIEKAGRLAYKSENKIDGTSAETFVNRLLFHDPPHLAVIEHSNFVVRVKKKTNLSGREYSSINEFGKYLSKTKDKHYYYVGGNWRAWIEAILYEDALTVSAFRNNDIVFLIELVFGGKDWEVCPNDEIPPELHRYSVKFTCNRAVSHELVRHRPCSFLQESQRYCRYSQDKFGSEVSFIKPSAFYEETSDDFKVWVTAMEEMEKSYFRLLETSSPQAARTVLPNSCKTEIIVTADVREWLWIKRLRTSRAADPSMQEIMAMVPWDMIKS